ncbi:hypothetical protein AFCA_011262 [Aspergillus flavus]|uniref:Hydroxyacyl dehydrogenase n=2 Tax=Aspergillus subgen. Circumdati TaxID=2720871 RepID=A0AB74CFV2_ASPFL|nr:putative short chain-type dehydrogenase [Aspergillus oryzae 3.042]KDE77868.1 putative short chain-type dehydrogenase [Aspergillus oryzae 100-8]RMZ45593.1 hydroxyacyl dehydrogenase [Aspergillus flavus]UDD64009.1 hypothetical protein AFCA_011262 [Aspergillus flavus]|eukprot:EIT74387.1 putative short chain-type dehydrogenase [Aspergillus oryzae 3.042]
MATYIVTGSARGLGLAMVKELASREPTDVSLVIAATRKSSTALDEIVARDSGRVIFIPLDVSNEASISSCVEKTGSVVGQKGVDVLINCAGVHSWLEGKTANMSDLDYQLSVNVVGTHNVTRAFLPLLKIGKSKKVANISTVYASMAQAEMSSFANCPAYKISKAALNALTVQYAMSYKDEGFIFLAVSPGWLKTDMGGDDAHLTAEEGAQAVLNVVDKAESDSNGCFKNIYAPGWDMYDGKNIPW